MSSSSKFTLSPRERRHEDVVETHRHVPVVEAEILVPRTAERLRVVERVDQRVVDAEAHSVTVAALDFEAVRTPLGHGSRAQVLRTRNEPELAAIRAVFVDARENV